MINLKNTSPLHYGINRFIETAIGIIVAVLVNRYICPYNEITVKSKEKSCKNTIEKDEDIK